MKGQRSIIGFTIRSSMAMNRCRCLPPGVLALEVDAQYIHHSFLKINLTEKAHSDLSLHLRSASENP